MLKDSSPRSALANWQDVPNDGSLDAFAKSACLNRDSLKPAKDGVIILPNNRMLSEVSKDKNLFAQDAKDILATLQAVGMQACLYDDGREKRELLLDSADVILPILLFVGTNATSLGLGILANWIYDRWIRTNDKEPPSIRAEYAEVDHHGVVVRWRKIEGPVTEVQRLLASESQSLAKEALPNAPKTSPAGSQDVLGEPWWITRCQDSADTALAVARELIKEAKEAQLKNNTDIAETLLRRSLVNIREALLWQPEEKAHSKFLHDVGHQIHDTFGCQLEFKDGQYLVTCPVMLSHSKGGFSIGGSGKAICSICGEEIFDCPHVKGHSYDDVVAKRHGEICNICAQREYEHIEGVRYNEVRAFAIVVEIDLDHVAWVENPANPLCVIQSYSVPKSELLKMLPKDERYQFVYGQTTIYCHHCLICGGMEDYVPPSQEALT